MDFVNKYGMTALHLAVEFQKMDAVKYLVLKGANFHVEDINEEDVCDKMKEINLTDYPETKNCSAKVRQKFTSDPAVLAQMENESESKSVSTLPSRVPKSIEKSQKNLLTESHLQMAQVLIPILYQRIISRKEEYVITEPEEVLTA